MLVSADDGRSLGHGWSGEVTVGSGCVLNGGGVEPSEDDDEIEGDECVLSGCVVIGSCVRVGLGGCSSGESCSCMGVIWSCRVGAGGFPAGATAKCEVDGALGDVTIAVVCGRVGGQGAPVGRRSSIA